MTTRKSRSTAPTPTQDGVHSRNLLLALSRVARDIQQVHEPEEIYRVVGEQIKALGFEATILTLDSDRSHLCCTYTTIGNKTIRSAEKLSGLLSQGYRWPISPDHTYGKIIDGRKAEFVSQAEEFFLVALPEPVRPLTRQLMQVLGTEHGILAPLCLDEEILGILVVFGNSQLGGEDLPAVESFAGQVAVSLSNGRLTQQMQEELSVRRQMEKSLDHNRNLLLALSRAAQSVQLARTADEIYQAVGGQIKSLGYEVIILTASDEFQYLNYIYSTFSKTLIETGEKLTGLSIQSYRFYVPPESTYGRVLRTGKGDFDHWTINAITGALPKRLSSLAGKLAQLLKIEKSVIAPLCVDGKISGTLSVAGSAITETDIPAIESFAAQVAISLNNTYLAQQAQRELTERKLAEEALRTSEAKIRALLDAIPDMMFLLNHEGIFIDYHAPRSHLLYAPPEIFLGKNIRDVMPPHMVEAYMAKLDQAIQSGESQLFEYTLDLADEQHYFEAHLVSYQDDNVLCNVRDITRRKQAEQAVGQAEKRFKALIENAPDGIILLGTDGKIKYASPSAINMFSYEVRDEVLKNPLDFIHPDDLAAVLGAMNELVQDLEHVPTLEYRFKSKDGTWHWVESTFSNLLTEPSVQAVVINFRDITERRQAEDALRASESKFHSVITESADGILISDEMGRIIEFNHASEEITGYPRETVIGRLVWDVQIQLLSDQANTPEFHEQLKVTAQKVLETGHSPFLNQMMEVPFRHADGSLRFLQQRTFSMQTENGWRLGCVLRDITERKLMDETLRISEERYRVLYEDNPSMYFTVDAKGMILSVNKFGVEKLGYSAEEFAGLSLFNIFHQDDRAAVQKHFFDCLQNMKQTVQIEARKICKDGTVLWVRESAHAVYDIQGQVVVLLTCDDVTERNLAEDALRESERKFHSVISESADGIVLSDETGKIIEFNNGVEEITGWSCETAIGQYLWDFNYELLPKSSRTREGYEHVKADIQQALETGQAPFMRQLMEAPIEHLDGSLHFVQQRVFSIQTEKGWRLGSVSRDVTERKKMEVALRASEESFRSLYQIIRLMTDNLPDLVWAKDMDGQFLFANKAISEKLLIAMDPEEPIGKTDLFFSDRQRASHPQDGNWHTFGELCVNSDAVIHASKSAQRFEEFGNVKGEFLFLDVYKAPFLDEQGTMIGTVGIGRDVTREKKLEEERKQVQDALAASEAELRALFTSMQDTVLVIDRAGIYRKVAPTNPDRFYIPPESVIGKHLSDFFPPEQVEKFLKVIRNVLDTKHTVQIEYEIDANGQSPWFESSISPMDEDCTLWVARDISERKQVEDKLQLQGAALEAAANTIVITDRDGLIQWANSSFANLTGYGVDEAIGKNSSELIKSGRQDQQFYKNLWNTILDGRIWHNELLNRRKDGTIYAEEMTITPLRNAKGEVSHFIAVKQDITKRKQAEAALIKSEQEYRLLFENMPIGLYRTSVTGQVLDANPALIRMFGFQDRSSFFALSAKEFYADPSFEMEFQEGIKSKDNLSGFEAQFRRQDNTVFWAEDYVRIIRDESGNPVFFEGSLIDTTERRKAEDELRRAGNLLEAAHRDLQKMFAHEQVLARTDDLTGLYNRRYFFELASREFNSSVRYQHPLTIILFDADGFKQANDTFGHAMGDKILIQIAQAAAMQVREVDVLARYGGDEFIILLPLTSTEQAYVIAERIRENVAAMKVDYDDSSLSVTLSLGVAETIHAPQDQSIESAIRRADQALYEAKQNGRNHTVIYNKK